MQRQHILLAIGALLVGGLAVYLFREVHATPAVAEGITVTKTHDEPTAPEPKSSEVPDAPKTLSKNNIWAAATKKPDTKTETNVTPPPRLEGDTQDDPPRADPKGDAILDEVNKAYDHGEYDDAKAMAQKILAKDPNNVRMLRVLVSSSCILGDAGDAQKAYDKLPQRDRDQMKTRCKRYDVTFTDGAPLPP